MKKLILIPLMLILIALPVFSATYPFLYDTITESRTNYATYTGTIPETYDHNNATYIEWTKTDSSALAFTGTITYTFSESLTIENVYYYSYTYCSYGAPTCSVKLEKMDYTSKAWSAVNTLSSACGISNGIYNASALTNLGGIRLIVSSQGSAQNWIKTGRIYEFGYNATRYTSGLNITTYDERTNTPITSETITYSILSNNITSSRTTATGTLKTTQYAPNDYDIIVSGATDYATPRKYKISLQNGNNNLKTYLIGNSTYNSILILRDRETSSTIENGNVIVKKVINGVPETISQTLTDVGGAFQLSYIPYNQYYFYYNYSGYQEKNFTLNPILFSSYNIGLTTLLTYDLKQISIQPNIGTYRNAYSNNLSINFYNPSVDSFTYYGFNISYPGSSGWEEINGTDPTGGTLTKEVNITGANLFDKVYLKIYYQRIGDTQINEINNAYYILISPGNYTWVNNRIDSKGVLSSLGLFEKILITTIIVMIAGGISIMVAGPVAGGVIGLIVLGFLAYIGLAPFSVVVISLIVGFIVISWRSSQ